MSETRTKRRRTVWIYKLAPTNRGDNTSLIRDDRIAYYPGDATALG